MLGLDRLLGLQGQQLVGGLGCLQCTTCRLALLHQVGQHAFVLIQVLRQLGLHAQGGVQAIQTLLPALARLLRHTFARDAARVLGRIQAGKLLVQALDVVRQPLRLGQ
ncbi:hypothetical protein FQZ97_1226660 [compost metagenome]